MEGSIRPEYVLDEEASSVYTGVYGAGGTRRLDSSPVASGGLLQTGPRTESPILLEDNPL